MQIIGQVFCVAEIFDGLLLLALVDKFVEYQIFTAFQIFHDRSDFPRISADWLVPSSFMRNGRDIGHTELINSINNFIYPRKFNILKFTSCVRPTWIQQANP